MVVIKAEKSQSNWLLASHVTMPPSEPKHYKKQATHMQINSASYKNYLHTNEVVQTTDDQTHKRHEPVLPI
jgi:hypothetical protein